jgi:hypothetical protein
VVARVIPDATKDSILPVVGEVLHPAHHDLHGRICHPRANPVDGSEPQASTVNHSKGYVDGWAHTNTIDGFWSLVKRGIGGVYYQVGGSICSRTLTNTRFGTTAARSWCRCLLCWPSGRRRRFARRLTSPAGRCCLPSRLRRNRGSASTVEQVVEVFAGSVWGALHARQGDSCDHSSAWKGADAIPAKWYVVLLTFLGFIGLVAGIADHSPSESLWSLLAFGMAAFAYFFYVRR